MIADVALAVVFVVGFFSLGVTALLVAAYSIDRLRKALAERRARRTETVAEAQARARREAPALYARLIAEELEGSVSRHPAGKKRDQ